jgi:hypothetical protein
VIVAEDVAVAVAPGVREVAVRVGERVPVAVGVRDGALGVGGVWVTVPVRVGVAEVVAVLLGVCLGPPPTTVSTTGSYVTCQLRPGGNGGKLRGLKAPVVSPSTTRN